jgi:hypothetical protein
MLFTVGYERRTVDGMIEILKDAGVRTLLDVRELPLSRRQGFPKLSTAGRATISLSQYPFSDLVQQRTDRQEPVFVPLPDQPSRVQPESSRPDPFRYEPNRPLLGSRPPEAGRPT